MAIKYVEIVAGTADARYPIDRTSQLAAGIYVDSNDGYKLKYIANGVVTQVLDNAGVQQGITSFATLSLGGTAWHTGNGQADTLSWPNPVSGAIIVTNLIIGYTHITTGAATLAAGTATASKITLADNLIDDMDLNGVAAPFAKSSLDTVDTERAAVWLASGGWITFTGSASVAGFIGNAYIYYIVP